MTDQSTQPMPDIAVLELRMARNGFVISAMTSWRNRNGSDRVHGYATMVVESKDPDVVGAAVAAAMRQCIFIEDAYIDPARSVP